MSPVSDKKIIDWIENKNYSKLTFLDECWLSSENEWYLGFYYFIQDFKQESKQDVFKSIVSRFDGESSAYCYLGNTAEKIFNSFDTHHVAASFYRKSIVLNKENSDAHWGLYHTSRNIMSCLESLKLDYKNEQFEKLKNKVNRISPQYNNMSGLSREDWLIIKKIILDERVCCRQDMLILAHDYLDELDEGLALIRSMDKVDVKIIKKYFDQNLISKDEVLLKIYDWQVSDFLGDDYKRIYQESVKESKKGNRNPTLSVLIQNAFQAEEFHDVITYYDGAPLDDIHFPHDLNSRLYYLLAQSYLDQNLNEKSLSYASKKIGSMQGNFNVLYQAIRFKQKIKELEKLFARGDYSDCMINIMAIYQDAEKIIENPEMLKHFLYEQLNS